MFSRDLKLKNYNEEKEYHVNELKTLFKTEMNVINKNQEKYKVTSFFNDSFSVTDTKETHSLNGNFVNQNKISNTNIKTCQNLFTEWRKVYKIQFDISVPFVPGDSIGLVCPNSRENVLELFKIINISDNESNNIIYCINRTGLNSKTYNYEFIGTLTDFFENYYDFKTIPKKAFLYSLMKTIDLSEKDNINRMKYLIHKDGSKDYFDIHIEWFNILDIIKAFNCKPSLNLILNYCSFIKPRYFSLTNKINTKCECILGVISKTIRTQNNEEKVIFGQCSEYIDNFEVNRQYNKPLRYLIKENKLLRMKESKKMLLIATGTGIAPFISFLRNRNLVTETWVIYGCRTSKDNILKRIIEEENFDDIKYNICYSSKNERVTTFIIENKHKLKEFTRNHCNFYICGNPRMQKETIEKLKETAIFDEKLKNLYVDNWY